VNTESWQSGIGGPIARQAARRRAPMCHRAKYTLSLRGEMTNKPGRKPKRIKCEDLTSTTAPNGPHRHE
jgi:hypothetical protein